MQKICLFNCVKKGFLPNILYKNVIDTTLQIDLSKEEDELLRQMRTTTRQNIRKAIASDIKFREGDESELGIFFRSYAGDLQATGSFT